MEYSIVFNSVYTPNMCRGVYGNETQDEKISWKKIEEIIEIIKMSPKDFYVIGIGFIHLRGVWGHPKTAEMIEEEKGIHIPFKRGSVKIIKGWVIVPAYDGKRLEEGATTLPPGAKLVPMLTRVNLTHPEVRRLAMEIEALQAGIEDLKKVVDILVIGDPECR